MVPQEKREGRRKRQGWRDDTNEAMERGDLAYEDCYRREERGMGGEKRRQL